MFVPIAPIAVLNYLLLKAFLLQFLDSVLSNARAHILALLSKFEGLHTLAVGLGTRPPSCSALLWKNACVKNQEHIYVLCKLEVLHECFV